MGSNPKDKDYFGIEKSVQPFFNILNTTAIIENVLITRSVRRSFIGYSKFQSTSCNVANNEPAHFCSKFRLCPELFVNKFRRFNVCGEQCWCTFGTLMLMIFLQGQRVVRKVILCFPWAHAIIRNYVN